MEAAPEPLTEQIVNHILVPIVCPHCNYRWAVDYVVLGVKAVLPTEGVPESQ